MLKSRPILIDLAAKRDELTAVCLPELTKIADRFGPQAIQQIDDEKIADIHYPVTNYPVKIHSLNLDKTPEASGILLGIKGQYLLLDTGVINIRKFSGYEIELTPEP